MLTDWFEWLDYDKWYAKWNDIAKKSLLEKKYDVQERLLSHSNWIKENYIYYTPAFFLNGKKVPNRYSIDNFRMLIPELHNIMKEYAM